MELHSIWISVIAFIAAWEAVWKGIALWKCGRNRQLVWFILIFVLNTAGILPIVYLILFRKKKG
jgi:methionyl-tRNA synthetase